MDNGDFPDLDSLRINKDTPYKPQPVVPLSTKKANKNQELIKGEFLKGPIPLSWLSRAAAMPGKAPLAVGLAIWFISGLRRNKTVKLTSNGIGKFGIDRKAKYRGLIALEQIGLITVERHQKKNPIVTIIEA